MMESSPISQSKEESVLRYADFDAPLGDNWDVDKTIIKKGTILTVTDIGKERVEKICAKLKLEGFKIDWVARSNSVVLKTLEDKALMLSIWNKRVQESFA